MSTFTVRIELHRATESDYEALHQAMQAGGFKRTVLGSDAKTYSMPPAEYRFEGTTDDTGAVRDKAHSIAKAIKPNPAVFVTHQGSGGSAWIGLDVVKV